MFPGRSPYEYCFSNPINLTDPTGMSPEGGGDGDPPNKNLFVRAWTEIKSWFSSDDDYKPIPKVTGTVEPGDIDWEGKMPEETICTVGCHPAPVASEGPDIAGQFRDMFQNIDTALDYTDATREAFGKGSILGKYSNSAAIFVNGGNLFADYYSTSSKTEFAQNSIITTVTTGAGMTMGPIFEVAIGTVLTDGTNEDGITNLKNNILPESYKATYNQTNAYLRANFGNNPSVEEQIKIKERNDSIKSSRLKN